jgi:hypothetical protein
LLTYLGIIEGNYLVSKTTDAADGFETIMFPVQGNLGICYYKE